VVKVLDLNLAQIQQWSLQRKLEPPRGLLSSSAEAQGNRAKALLDWAEDPTGPGSAEGLDLLSDYISLDDILVSRLGQSASSSTVPKPSSVCGCLCDWEKCLANPSPPIPYGQAVIALGVGRLRGDQSVFNLFPAADKSGSETVQDQMDPEDTNLDNLTPSSEESYIRPSPQNLLVLFPLAPPPGHLFRPD